MYDADIDSYKIVNKGEKEIKLNGEGELKPISDTVGEYSADISQRLSKIIKDLNEAFGTEFTEDDKVFLSRVKDHLMANTDLLEKIQNNSKQNVKAIFDEYFNQEMTKLLHSNMTFYKRIVDNDKLRTQLKTALLELVYFEYRKNKKE